MLRCMAAAEIADAVCLAAGPRKPGHLERQPAEILDVGTRRHLYQNPIPTMVIRTSGEQRRPASCSGNRRSELYCEAYGPDFAGSTSLRALRDTRPEPPVRRRPPPTPS
jgi:undecaprenyl pyrophosphate synthase